MQGFSQATRLCSVTMAALVSSSGLSFAGAWLQPEGKTEIIFSSLGSDAKRRFTRESAKLSTERFSKQHMIVSAERGWNDNVALLARAQVQHLALTAPDSERHSILGAGALGLKVKLWSEDRWMVSAEATVQTGREMRFPKEIGSMAAPTEAELRINVGYSFTILEMPAFGDIQTAYRWRNGAPHEIRLDGTLGFRPMTRVLVMFQSFNMLALTKDSAIGSERVRQHKLQPSVVLDLTKRLSVQIGAFAVVAGSNTVKERGGMGAIWWKF